MIYIKNEFGEIMAKEVNFDTWDKDVTKSSKPIVVDFWHEQCIWCKRLNPIYEELSNEYKDAVLAKLNIRANRGNLDLAIKYGISGTPTIKVFCKGREVGEIVGFMQKDQLRSQIDNVIKKSDSCFNKSSPLK